MKEKFGEIVKKNSDGTFTVIADMIRDKSEIIKPNLSRSFKYKSFKGNLEFVPKDLSSKNFRDNHCKT
jgi:hypothetical protein